MLVRWFDNTRVPWKITYHRVSERKESCDIRLFGQKVIAPWNSDKKKIDFITKNATRVTEEICDVYEHDAVSAQCDAKLVRGYWILRFSCQRCTSPWLVVVIFIQKFYSDGIAVLSQKWQWRHYPTSKILKAPSGVNSNQKINLLRWNDVRREFFVPKLQHFRF